MKKLFTLICMVLACAYCLAQDRNNEDEVVKIDWYNQHATKEGELIVKFADHTTLRLQNDARGALQATGMNKVDALLQQYPVAKAERLCPNDDPKRELKTSKSYNGPDVVEHDLSRLCRFVMQDPKQTYEMIQTLKELDEVEFAEPNYMAFALGSSPDRPLSPVSPLSPIKSPTPREGGYFNPTAYMAEPMYPLQWGLEAVNLPELWAADTMVLSTDRKVIAILDTGVDIDHPDLAANIWTNPGETDNGYDDDNNGFADDLHGWDFVNQTADMHDWNSHGTHCAGIAAAVGDNGIGITGANPMAYIMPIAVLQSNGTGDIATIIQGINYAKNNGADVLSMSFGSYSYSIALEQALGQAYQSAVLVAAAGNDGLDMILPGVCEVMHGDMFPAAFTFVLGVEATQHYPGLCGYRACFSNYDCDGPSFSQYGEERLYNYELQAPGAGIHSTVPNGHYRSYNGTSMSAPLVAGGISALLHAKPYISQEMLWGDLINTAGNHVNFMACYEAGEAPAQLQFVAFETNDTINGDGDGRPDAGETICLYPTLRSTWGATNDITMWLTLNEFEDPNIVTFLDTEPVDFGWPLSAYAKSKSVNPLRFTIDPDCVDGRYINLVLHAISSDAQAELVYPFTIQVENGVELGGMINDTVTLYPNVHYIVTSNLALTESALMVIKPGTTLKFMEGVGLSNVGRIYAVGTPDSLITFTKADLGNSWDGMILNYYDTLDYCAIEYIDEGFSLRGQRKNMGQNCGNVYYYKYQYPIVLNSIIRKIALWDGCYLLENIMLSKSNFYENYIGVDGCGGLFEKLYRGDGYVPCETPNLEYYQKNNIIRNIFDDLPKVGDGMYESLLSVFNFNWFGNDCLNYWGGSIRGLNIGTSSTTPWEVPFGDRCYLGSAREDIVRQHVYDFDYPGSNTFGRINLDNMATQPTPDAHGIVWKVEVNGYDAQDEFEQMPPLGCGTHEFKVYFNRPMDTLVTPMLAMGVRPPYTQHRITRNRHWNADGTIYSATITIDGYTATDGLNRIYVAEARDTEHFEIPIEDFRFNVQVASAGSLSNEFMATPGLGKVDLEWNNNEVDFEDFLGYNMYRYVYDSVPANWHWNDEGNWVCDSAWMPTDTLQLNTSLIQDTVFTDYNVVPGQRYYYFYKVLRTNLSESEASLTVTTVPLTSIPGDANGSMAVDVADVVSLVSYLTNGNPQPFIFEAADINGDGTIDILDIVGVINLIINRGGLPDANPVATAYYSIEDGILFVDTPVELGGVQFVFENNETLEALQALEGFEQVTAETSNGTLFMAYSMSGKKLPAGKHALLRMGEAQINTVALSDPEGRNVLAIAGGAGVEEHETLFLEQPYPNPFNGNLTIPFIIGDETANHVVFTVTNMMGQTVSVINLGSRGRGEYKYEWSPASSMAPGIYTVSMQVNGRMVQHAKVVYVR